MCAVQTSPRITPFLWFDKNGEEAADFYVSVFKNSRKTNTLRSAVDTPSGPKGSVLAISFELDGVKFTALNGGPGYPFTQAVSFVVSCDSQEEIDDYWTKLTEGGKEIQCGWLVDKFGLSWQVVPAQILELVKHPKAMKAMMGMIKMDMAELERAAKE